MRMGMEQAINILCMYRRQPASRQSSRRRRGLHTLLSCRQWLGCRGNGGILRTSFPILEAQTECQHGQKLSIILTSNRYVGLTRHRMQRPLSCLVYPKQAPSALQGVVPSAVQLHGLSSLGSRLFEDEVWVVGVVPGAGWI